jgi:hypothetical protein
VNKEDPDVPSMSFLAHVSGVSALELPSMSTEILGLPSCSASKPGVSMVPGK